MKTVLAAAAALALFPAAAQASDAQAIAYDFRFEIKATDLASDTARERAEQRLHREAARYCRAETRAAGVPEQASLCTQIVVTAVKEKMDERANRQYAAR